VEVPQDLVLDGIDFTPALNNQAIPRAKPLIWVYYNAPNYIKLNHHQIAMRDGDWKVVAKLDFKKKGLISNIYNGNEESIKATPISDIQIYKITVDITESEALNDKYPEKFSELKEKLLLSYKELLDGSYVWGK
jgi:arylsulfatase A